MTPETPGPDPAPWRPIVEEEAREAALVEARGRWDTADHPFNYRWEHVQTVVRLALRLAQLTGADREVVEAAAWLHDCRKEGQDDGHGAEGAAAARRILAQTDFPPAKIEAVADAIAKHVGLYTDGMPVEPLEAAVLWDADKLSKLGSTSVLHYVGDWVATGQGTVAVLLERVIHWDWADKTVASLHTAPARAAGRRRLAVERDFWTQATRELAGNDLLGPQHAGATVEGDMTERVDKGREFTIVARVIKQEGHCAAGHRVGDEVILDGETVQGRVCIHALYSFLPKVFAMRYGATFPWLEDPDVATHACPDAWNPVVFQIQRVREKGSG